MHRIPFNRPYATGRELEYIQQAIADMHLSGAGQFTARCQAWLEQRTGAAKALLTQSCTAALEMAALLARIGIGDEVIMPSYTFVSTANAFVLRGAVPVFVDIRSDTLNLDETMVEAAITDRTRAIVCVHYAGVGCAMEALIEIARRHGLLLIEDGAQAMLARYHGRPLGSFGDLATLSFHETKNVIAGEGGALLVNRSQWVERAEVVWEKGTDRRKFFRGAVDKYTWIDLGSSFLPSEITAAFLWAQMEQAEYLTAQRLELWHRFHGAFALQEELGRIRRPVVPAGCEHNGHCYYLLVPDPAKRAALLARLRVRGISAHFHYVPLHDSPAGSTYGRAAGQLPWTRWAAERIVRLPLWVGMTESELQLVIAETCEALEEIVPRAQWALTPTS